MREAKLLGCFLPACQGLGAHRGVTSTGATGRDCSSTPLLSLHMDSCISPEGPGRGQGCAPPTWEHMGLNTDSGQVQTKKSSRLHH